MVDRFYLKNVSLGCNLEYEKTKQKKKTTKNEKKSKQYK